MADDAVLDLASWERYLAAFDACADHVYRLAILLVSNRHDAEDLTRDLFLAAHAPWRDGRIDDLPHHLRRDLVDRVVAEEHRHRLAGHLVRWRAGHRPSAPDGRASDPTGLLAALDRLDIVPRAVIALRYYENLSITETAAILRTEEQTVDLLVRDALRLLRPALEVVH